MVWRGKNDLVSVQEMSLLFRFSFLGKEGMNLYGKNLGFQVMGPFMFVVW